MEHNALALPAVEEEMGRLLGSYAGEATVSRDGELVYTFPEIMTSAHGPVTAKEPNPAWLRMEYPLEMTGNEKKHDAIIMGMNGFTLVAGATAPWFIFPQLGLGGTTAFVGLVLIPVVFSVLFYTLPLLRILGVRRENRARKARNVRRQVLGLVYREALAGKGSVSLDMALAHVQARLKDQPVDPSEVEGVLHQLASEFDADVSTGADSALLFTFSAIRRQFVASETVRQRLKLEDRAVGDVVYSSADTAGEESERDQAAFDRDLKAAEMNLSAYLPSPNRSGFEDDYEIVEFDEQLARRTVGR
jgi:hypothetical protein